jgi:hypothetical protein
MTDDPVFALYGFRGGADRQARRMTLDELGAKWMDRIRAAAKREDQWIKTAEAAERAYLCDDEAAQPGEVPDFNILHSNVETIVPSIYNSTAVPDIRPRQGALDQVAKLVASVYEGAISCMTDDNALDTEIEASAQDTFLTGRGIVRVKLDADVEGEAVSNERVVFENVSWRDYRFGPCKRFETRPWEAFRHCIDREELEGMEDDEIAGAYGADPASGDDDYYVWEVWDKAKRRVLFIVEDTCRVVSVKDDPLGLKDFYSVRSIAQPITATGKTLPVCPYVIYRTLAKELDTATARINNIMKGLKVRGIIAGDASIMETIAALGDNELAPVGNIENLAATGGLDKAVLWWPVDTAIVVLKELYLQREQTKQAIYEITGISDIIRGQGNAQATATQEKIKTQWGALRIKKMQRLIERQVRDLFGLAVEIMARHFSTETLVQLSGVQPPQPPEQPQPTGDQQQDAQAFMQWQEAAQQAQQAAQEFERLLRDPMTAYRVDVESDSTVRADVGAAQEQMGTFLEATGQFFQVMAPLAQTSPAMAEPIAEIWGAFADKYNLGKRAEDALAKMIDLAKQAAQQPPSDPEKANRDHEMQMKQMDMEAKQQELAMKSEAEGQKAQTEARKAEVELQIKQVELQIRVAELQLKGQQAQQDAEMAQQDMRLREQESVVNAQMTMAQMDQESDGADADREFQAREADANRQFTAREAQTDRQHNAQQADADRKAAKAKETAQ